MRCVNVDTLAQGECGGVVVNRCVGRRVMNRNWSVGKSGNELLDIPNSQSASSRGAESRIIPEVEIDAKKLGKIDATCGKENLRVVETYPLLFRE